MNNSTKTLKSLVSVSFLLIFAFTTFAAGADITAEDVIKRHVQSLGTPEALAAAKHRIIQGKAKGRVVQASITEVVGTAVLISTEEKRIINLAFETVGALDYSKETLLYDGKTVTAPFINSSQRSALGDFIFEYKEILKSGLMGGTLFPSWALANNEKGNMKLSFLGNEKLNGREVSVLKGVPRGGSSLAIKLYFDASTFEHVRTRYKYSQTPFYDSVAERSPIQREITYDLIEDFSDYRTIEGLRLPLDYRITFAYENVNRNRQFEWQMKFSRFSFGTAIEDDKFRVE